MHRINYYKIFVRKLVRTNKDSNTRDLYESIYKHLEFIYFFVPENNLFSKVTGKFCGRGTQCNQNEEPRYGNYSTFEEAAMACSNDPTCEMVMDRHCDEQGYELCSTTKLCSSAEGTCSFTRLSGYFDEIEGNRYSVV